jgi:hypothetical protein
MIHPPPGTNEKEALMSGSAKTVLLVVLLAVPAMSSADVIRVDMYGGGDYLNIQDALYAVDNHDTVRIAPGTYTGFQNRGLVIAPGKNFVIESENGFPTVTIDCQGMDRAFYLHTSAQDTTTVIRGLIIQNGYTDNYNGGGMILHDVSVIVEDCLFKDCVASHNGGALSIGYTYNGTGCKVRNCVFQGNSATYRGGALIVDHASAYIRNCLFFDNSTSYVGDDFYGGGAIHLNWVDDNPDYRCTISRCTVVGNSSPGNGSGILGWHSEVWTFLSTCIVAFNSGPGLGVYSDPMFDGFTFSDVYGNEGGNLLPGYSTIIEEDPRFCGMASDDYTLCSNSPALPGGNVWTVLMGFAGEGCGDCDSAVRETSWGLIKALYLDEED